MGAAATRAPAEDGRFAVYFAPAEGSRLADLGRRWLGRPGADAHPPPTLPGLSAGRLSALTESPRHYGFHGTLKPPFRLARGRSGAELAHTLDSFAAQTRGFELPPFEVAALGRFLALVPSQPCPRLDALAEACVRHFDAFRAPPPPDETLRRRAAGLSERQERLLDLWGYPYVMEEFRFHLTLTGPINDADDRRTVKAYLEALAAPACAEPTRLDALSLFWQPDSATPFRPLSRHPLGE
ncbi:DUF1045 domain-containing protein [Roseospirillum parvum]|uniref:Putative phosphonate metabolism protein n=1 Tax=Roseospirillum parvum TaxID=83401 RepID=A0A1G8ESS5_9PROT|nr:DUF1045 domain-containing protein [Roseospirillum parvum]SDH72910.1 putative phosphonate metabolism protein [Roseospirillum parvum]